MGEPVNREGVTCSVGAGEEAFVAAVVFGGGSDIPTVDSMGSHVGTLVGCNMDDDSSARRGQGRLVEIKGAVEAGVGGQFGLAARGTEQVQSELCLGHKKVPFKERELGVAGGEASAEMVFPHLDGAFGCVAAMHLWWNALEGHVVLLEGCFEFV